jgi:hypothetical protein
MLVMLMVLLLLLLLLQRSHASANCTSIYLTCSNSQA